MSDEHSYFPETRATMINALGDGSSPAWDMFARIYGPIVHRFARSAGLSEHDANDVLQIVMRNFWQRTRQGDFRVDREKGRFRYYLRKMTNHVIARYKQERGRLPRQWEEFDPADEEPVKDDGWNEIEQQERLRVCFERLRATVAINPDHLRAFEMYALQGRPAGEVAAELKLSTSRVYAIKNEVIKQIKVIREQLDDLLGEV